METTCYFIETMTKVQRM